MYEEVINGLFNRGIPIFGYREGVKFFEHPAQALSCFLKKTYDINDSNTSFKTLCSNASGLLSLKTLCTLHYMLIIERNYEISRSLIRYKMLT